MGSSRPRFGASRALGGLSLLHVVSIFFFIQGFLLTRIRLNNRSTLDEPVCARPYSKLVWIVIDALRYDFVVQDARYPCTPPMPCSHQQQMPFTSSLISNSLAVKSFRYIADAPTTTTQRIKSMVSGGLPTFFDVSNSFTAGSMDEDNLIDQLSNQGRQLTFMGDATWSNLFPTQFNTSLPFPCFNVKDLDTVDDGIWQNLLPTIRRSRSYDVLIAHYLGVDHAGHTFGVESVRMAEKLRQMDDHIHAVLDTMIAQNEYDDTLLLISGDHGQTMGGDHGGGSPEEVDSVLVAVDIGRLRKEIKKKKKNDDDDDTDEKNNNNDENNDNNINDDDEEMMKASIPECRSTCTCGADANQCVEDLNQIDLVPTLAAMLNIPIPFVNLGRLQPELWSLAGQRCSSIDPATDSKTLPGDKRIESREMALKHAIISNARQVYAYLMAYSSHPAARGFSRPTLKKLRDAYAALDDHSTQSMYVDFLSMAHDAARDAWTQFNDIYMAIGIGIFNLAVLKYGISSTFDSILSCTTARINRALFRTESRSTLRHAFTRMSIPLADFDITALLLPCILWSAILAQSLGIFSFFYLLSEGKMIGCIIACMTVVIMLFLVYDHWSLSSSVSSLSLSASTSRQTTAPSQRVHNTTTTIASILLQGIAALLCNALVSYLGLAHHSGYGFWQRLTVVHDPHDIDQSPGSIAPLYTSKNLLQVVEHYLGSVVGSWQASLCVHSMVYFIPLGILYSVYVKWSGGTHGVSYIYALQRSIISSMYSLLAVYFMLEWCIQQGICDNHITLSNSIDFHPYIYPFSLIRMPLFFSQKLPISSIFFLDANLSLHLLLPRSILVLACASLFFIVVQARRVDVTCTACNAIATLAALMTLLSSTVTPLLISLLLVQYMLHAMLLKNHSMATACIIPVAALMQTQAFYITGHLCEFAGLSYTAGFVGYEEFNLLRSGALVAVDTLGGMVLIFLVGIHSIYTMCPGSMNEKNAHIKAALLGFSFSRALACLCATISAAVQRRHLYSWALFAPKFAFEAVFLFMTDVVAILISFLV